MTATADKNIRNEILVPAELDVLESGCWGTMGRYAMSASDKLAKYVGAEYGLLCSSSDGAYEAVLRSFEPVHGDIVVTAAYGNPSDSLIAVCAGVAPLFCDTEKDVPVMSADSLSATLKKCDIERIKCVTVDYAEGFGGLDRIAAVCAEYGLPLVVNAGGDFALRFNGEPLTKYAAAVIYTLGEGSTIYTGEGGFAATDSQELYAGASAYHNCGHGLGESGTLDFSAIVGGDLRVTEWIAVIVETIIDKNMQGQFMPRAFELMHRQPVFSGEYFRKMTGYKSTYNDKGLDNAIALAKI